MDSSLAALLGDTNFPSIMMSMSKGERILRYQDFYKNYSRLGLTRQHDRPIAIDGLQSRLLKAFNTEGGFGILDEGLFPGHLRRSLLWHRASNVPALKRINFSPDTDYQGIPPSWSWMAYMGGIDYLHLEFDGIEWERLQSPWSRRGWPLGTQRLPDGGMTLRGSAHEMNLDEFKATKVDGEASITYDIPGEVDDLVQRCVVLGRTEKRVSRNGRRMCYALIITPVNEPGDSKELWRRIGVGALSESCISGKGRGVLIR